MIEETPAKVGAFLGLSLFSLFFLFAVSATNASFNGTQGPLPDTFSSEKIVALVDSVSNSYSQFMNEAVIQPVAYSLMELADGYNYVTQEIADQYGQTILSYTGLEALARVDGPNIQPVATAEVAGAYTEAINTDLLYEGFNIDTLYAILFP